MNENEKKNTATQKRISVGVYLWNKIKEDNKTVCVFFGCLFISFGIGFFLGGLV